MKNVLIRIRQYASGASGAEKGVLDYITRSPEEASRMNIHELAAVSFSSASTIVRLCRKLGFEGYRELQSSLLYELAVRRQNQDEAETHIRRAGGLEEIVEKVTYHTITSLEDTMRILEEEALLAAVDLLERSRTIYLFGLGASQIVAQDAYLKFLRLGRPCACSSDIHSQILFARNAEPQDVALIISYSGSTEEMLTCANQLSANGVPIIAITRFDNSPLAQLATCRLYAVAMEEVYRSGAMSSRTAQLNIIDILFTALVNRSYDESIVKLERNRIRKNDRGI